MSVRSFFDTSVLVYADDKTSAAKRRRAIELVAVTRKLGLDPRIARRKVELLAEFDVVAPDVSDILAAIDLHRLHQISFWDAMVVRAAGQAGCPVLFSEDMQESHEVDGVRVVNPFQ
jgi:predicted nucleic acid-binding protein